MPKHSKRYRGLAEKQTAQGPLPLSEAVSLLKQFATTKFDQTVEIAMRLGVDPKQADQIVRGSIVLPHGIGGRDAEHTLDSFEFFSYDAKDGNLPDLEEPKQ